MSAFPIPQGVYGVCDGCGAVAWELLDGRSTACLDCDPAAYRDEGDFDWCGGCDCDETCWCES